MKFQLWVCPICELGYFVNAASHRMGMGTQSWPASRWCPQQHGALSYVQDVELGAAVQPRPEPPDSPKPAGWRVVYGNYYPREVIATFVELRLAEEYVERFDRDASWNIEPFYFDEPAAAHDAISEEGK